LVIARGWTALYIALTACGRLGFDVVGDSGTIGDVAPPGPWQIVQTVAGMNGSTQIAPTGAGNLVIVAVEYGALTGISDDAVGGSNTYAPVPGTHALDAMGFNCEIWTAAGVHGGATHLTFTGSNSWQVVWEVSGLSSTVDVAGELSTQPAGVPVAPALTTTRDGDFLIGIVVFHGAITGITGPFTLDSKQNGDGWGHLTATNAPAGAYQVTWTGVNDTFGSSAAAFFVGP
jgi:hypothetical protein